MRYGGTGLTFWLLWSVLCVMAVQDSRYCQSFVQCDGIGLTLWSILCAVAAQGSCSGQSGRSYVSWRHKTRADGTRLALRSILCATDGIGLTFWSMLCAVAAQDAHSGYHGGVLCAMAAQDSRYGQSYVIWRHRTHFLVSII